MWLSLALIGFAMGIVIWWISIRVSSKAEQVAVREAGSESLFLPLVRWIGRALTLMLPDFWASSLRKNQEILAKAGLDHVMEPADIPGIQLSVAMFCGTMLAYFMQDQPLWAIGAFVAGWWYPRSYVQGLRTERQDELMRQFPTALDMMVLCLDGGLDFSGGMKEVVQHADEGPLRQELTRVILDINRGLSRVDALRRMAGRVDALEIRMVVTALIQAINLGSGIAQTLRIQAEQMRYTRLTRAEEAAQKAPSKMVLPMMLFIVPCTFIVILVPFAMSVMESLKGF